MSLNLLAMESILTSVTGESKSRWGRGRTIFGIETEELEEVGDQITDAAGADGSGDDTAVREQAESSDGPDATLDKPEGASSEDEGGITTEVKENGEVDVEITLDKDVVEAITAKVEDTEGETPEETPTEEDPATITEADTAAAAAEAYGACEAMFLAISLQDEYVWSKEADEKSGEKKGNWFTNMLRSIGKFFRYLGQQILLLIKRAWAFLTGKGMKKAAQEILDYAKNNGGLNYEAAKAKVKIPAAFKIMPDVAKALDSATELTNKISGQLAAGKPEGEWYQSSVDTKFTSILSKLGGADSQKGGDAAETTGAAFKDKSGGRTVGQALSEIVASSGGFDAFKKNVKDLNYAVKVAMDVAKRMEKAAHHYNNTTNTGKDNAATRDVNNTTIHAAAKKLSEMGRNIMKISNGMVSACTRGYSAAIAIGRNAVANHKKESGKKDGKK